MAPWVAHAKRARRFHFRRRSARQVFVHAEIAPQVGAHAHVPRGTPQVASPPIHSLRGRPAQRCVDAHHGHVEITAQAERFLRPLLW